MFRITQENAVKLATLIAKNKSLIVPKSIHTTSSIKKWGDVYIPPELDTWEKTYPKDFKEHPDRDLVNFPHPVLPLYPSKVRHAFIPDSWFTIFYPKTGVTGGYLFYGGLAMYLIQKEWFIVTDELGLVVMQALLALFVYKLGGARLSKAIGDWKQKEFNDIDKYVKDNRSIYTDAIATQKDYVRGYAALPPMIAEVKRENVQLQLEAEYRRRLLKAHAEIKRRLDYMADLEDAKRRFQRRYMVDWIVEQVKKSVTPQQEKVLLSQCVADLKSLAQRSTT